MKIKNAALLLIIASIIWLIDLLYFTFERFTGDSAKYYKDKPVELVMSTLLLVMPITFLIFSIAVYNKKPVRNISGPVDDNYKSDVLSLDLPNMTVGNWIGIFFVSIIPLVGFIFLIIWALDKENPIRKNWAIASLIFMIFQVLILCGLFLLIYTGNSNYGY